MKILFGIEPQKIHHVLCGCSHGSELGSALDHGVRSTEFSIAYCVTSIQDRYTQTF